MTLVTGDVDRATYPSGQDRPANSNAIGLRGALESRSVERTAARVAYDVALRRTSDGDAVGAMTSYEVAVFFQPDFAEAHSNLGNAYRQAGRRDDALRSYAAAIAANAQFAPAYCNLAALLIELERYDTAIRALDVALRLAPDMAEAYGNLGQAYRRSGRLREGIAATWYAIELRPDRDAYLSLSVAAYEIDACDIALEANRRALEIDARCALAHCNSATLHLDSGRYSEAIQSGEAAIALRPNYAEAHVNLALALLACADFARGWDEYVWVWRLPSTGLKMTQLRGATLWNGESFAGRALVITHDQGFGDAIQMARFFPQVKARGGRVVLETAPELVPLFKGLPGVDEVRSNDDSAASADAIDLYVPILGLPRAFRTDLSSIPAPVPYVAASADRIAHWRPRLATTERLRVGIVWAGNPGHSNDRHRSVRLEDFAPLSSIDGIAWFGLQKGRDDNRTSCDGLTLEPLGPDIADFADTAAILTHLDLVIAVDTAIVHLAGAMGKPVWTLLPFASDWRWMTERVDSPWYPTMRLFRQPRAGDWAAVFADVARELRLLC